MTAVAALPKADIHLHAETKARVDRLASRREGRKPYDWRANVESLSQVPAGIQRLEAISSAIEFPEVNQIARGSFVEWVSEAMHEAAREGAVLVEIRFGAGWVLWPDLMPKFREAELLTKTKYPGFCAEAVISGLSPWRPDGNVLLDACLEARRAGLAGIDFIPTPYEREAKREQWDETYSWAERAASVGQGITVHAGEFSPANILKALGVPGVSRIGHAVHAASDSVFLIEMVKAQVTVECCLTSNVVLGAVPSLKSHPIRTFIDFGIPVALNSDDPVSLCTSIGNEYGLAACLGLSAPDLLGLTRNGIAASFTSGKRKAALLSQIDQRENRRSGNR